MSARLKQVRRIAWLLPLLLALQACGKVDATTGMAVSGDARHGRELIRTLHCGACHTVPGVRGANGVVGPPLDFFSRRGYIAGRVPNTPANLQRWLQNPQAIDPQTAMPRLGLDLQQARDVAAYLYTLD